VGVPWTGALEALGNDKTILRCDQDASDATLDEYGRTMAEGLAMLVSRRLSLPESIDVCKSVAPFQGSTSSYTRLSHDSVELVLIGKRMS